MRAQYHARLETAGQSLTYARTCTHVAPAPRTPDPIPTPLGGAGARICCMYRYGGADWAKKNPLWGVCALVCDIGCLLSTIPRRWEATGNVYSVPSTYGLKCPIFVHWVGTMPVWDTCAYNQERSFICREVEQEVGLRSVLVAVVVRRLIQ
jgi:hypothetical protein